jgi:hypothetical protein
MPVKIDGEYPLIEKIPSEESMSLKRGRQFMSNDGNGHRMHEGRERKNTDIWNVRNSTRRRHSSITYG